MPATSEPKRNGPFHAVAAGFLGWTLDAFDFFVVVFLYDTLAHQFGVDKSRIIFTTTATLAMRPIGAIVFGLLADRYGRRIPLMINVIFFSVIEVLCGFSPNFTFFLVMRALYGIGMGGEWGVGASLAMEAAPKRWRGVLSGILQSGYSVGFFMAAFVSWLILPTLGWRWMFWLGGIPALLTLYIRSSVPESEAWQQHRAPSTGAVLRIVAGEWKRLAYLVLLMIFMMCLSHGTQDLYPDFLRTAHHAGASGVAMVTMLFNVGAICGAILFGTISERYGRRLGMIGALTVSLLVLPLWAFGGTLGMLAVGSFLMQVGVQGAWGVIPVHLNEMSHDATRGIVPGLAYQLGILFAAPTPYVEYALRDRIGYQWALAAFEIMTILVLMITISLGKERRGRSFTQETPVLEPAGAAPVH